MANTGKPNADYVAADTKKKLHWLEIGYFSSQIGLAVIGIWALTIYHGQQTVMQGQLNEMKRSGEQSTKQMWSAIGNINWLAHSMDLSEKQSERSLGAALDQNKLDQRAWVGVVSIDPPNLAPRPDFFLSLHAMNSGHTPALNFQSLVVLHSLKKDEPFKALYDPLPAGWIRSNRVVQPGEQVTLNTNKYMLTQDQVDSVRNGSYVLYVYGKMSYDDIFRERHHTTFCKLVISETLVEDCGTYNTAD